MIKNLFLPEQIRGSFIFDQTYLGLEITKTSLAGTKIKVSGKKASILDFYYVPVIKKENETAEESTISALNDLHKKTGSCHVKLSLPNNIAIFKELSFPFLEKEKIKQVLPYELDPQIPFSIHDIAFDFIITKQDKETKKSTILVGIVQKKDITYYLNLLEKAQFPIKTITIDIFALYNLYAIHPKYKNFTEATTLLDIGFQYTTISYTINNELLAIRSINYGLNTIAKNIAEKTKSTPSKILEHILRFGFAKTDAADINKAITAVLTQFSKQINFTLDAFSAQITNYVVPKKIILITRGTHIKEFDEYLSKMLSIPTEFFTTNDLVSKQLNIKAVVSKIPLINVISLGAAYPFAPAASFDLLQSLDLEHSKILLKQQLFTAFFMTILFFGLLIGYGYIQKSGVRKKINRAKQSALSELTQEFDIADRNLATAVENAQQKLDEEEAIWEGFAGKFKYSFLKYLQDLCVRIDREGIGLDLKKLIMNKENTTLIGQVRDYKALKTFEEELNESKLFKLISVPQKPKFEVKLIIKNEGEERS